MNGLQVLALVVAALVIWLWWLYERALRCEGHRRTDDSHAQATDTVADHERHGGRS